MNSTIFFLCAKRVQQVNSPSIQFHFDKFFKNDKHVENEEKMNKKKYDEMKWKQWIETEINCKHGVS